MSVFVPMTGAEGEGFETVEKDPMLLRIFLKQRGQVQHGEARFFTQRLYPPVG